MNTIQPEKVIVLPNRQRKEFDADALHELMLSIEKNGLLHPIILRSAAEPALVAGERRLRACQLLLRKGKKIRYGQDTYDQVPCVYMGDLSQLQYEEAELEENIIRVDISWQEKANAVARLHELKVQENPGQTQTATARLVLGNDASSAEATRLVRDSQIIAKHLSDPEVAKAKTATEAMKVIRKKAEKEARNAVANLVQSSHSDHQLLLGDARVVLPELLSGSADCILTDPPYGIGADSFGDQAQVQHDYQDDEDYFHSLMDSLSTESFRIAKPQAHLYMFMDLRHWDFCKRRFQAAGWNVWPNPLIWSKHNGMLPRPEHGPRRTYEAILFANKGDKKVTGVFNDVLDIPPVADKRHGAEKPVPLYMDLLRRSTFPGDTILDPFAGSGTIFPAANCLRLKAIGINFSQDDYNLSKMRLDEGLSSLIPGL